MLPAPTRTPSSSWSACGHSRKYNCWSSSNLARFSGHFGGRRPAKGACCTPASLRFHPSLCLGLCKALHCQTLRNFLGLVGTPDLYPRAHPPPPLEKQRSPPHPAPQPWAWAWPWFWLRPWPCLGPRPQRWHCHRLKSHFHHLAEEGRFWVVAHNLACNFVSLCNILC